jgi:molecular chaperone IbpA
MTRLVPFSVESSFLGFDNIFNQLDRMIEASKIPAPTFPPFNLFRDEGGYTIEMALAGYKKDDIKVSHDRKNRLLTISHDGSLSDEYATTENRQLIRGGIARRKFQQTFTVADNLQVESATMVDGLLSIKLRLIEREEDKPLLISIS